MHSTVSVVAALCLALVAGGTSAREAMAGELPEELIVPGVVGETFKGDLGEIRKRGVLRALVSFSRTDFFLDGARPRGIFVELLDLYAKELNKGLKRRDLHTNVKYVLVPVEELIPALLAGKGDVAVGNLTVTPAREEIVDFAVDRRDRIDELLVTHKSVQGIASVDDLSGRTVHVPAGSSYQEHLAAINARLQQEGEAPIDVRVADRNLVTEDLLEMVNAGVIVMTVADDYRAKLWAEVLTDVEVHEDVTVHEGGIVGWAVRKGNPELRESLQAFAETVKIGTTLGNVLLSRYYKNVRWIKNPGSTAERKKLEQVRELFEIYGKRYGFDWLAVAAQAYQESGLDHTLKSPAGAIGIMQLLPTTAKDPNVGIPDIVELEANIHAGTKYLAFLRDRYFSDPALREEDKFAFSWAAYNAGPAKVRRMRGKAKELGLDPNRWFGNVEHAALAIVGQETVRYVGNIYKYYLTYRLVMAADERRKRKIERMKQPVS